MFDWFRIPRGSRAHYATGFKQAWLMKGETLKQECTDVCEVEDYEGMPDFQNGVEMAKEEWKTAEFEDEKLLEAMAFLTLDGS
ncbi:hypothetical protein NDU88_002149 [Pleurodeles waltl]|uniref:Uncharacterized protein n=1 Tax=Pleurodeles waltl TaxID=8319 RepID=A0AAV7Q7V9_PLEWA|nr:hypothetical protein NDU88_002149 [Pleurodeles waltl]